MRKSKKVEAENAVFKEMHKKAIALRRHVTDKIHSFRIKEKNIFDQKMDMFLAENQKSDYLCFFIEVQKFIAHADNEMISRANILVDEINQVQKFDKDISCNCVSKLLDKFVNEIRDYFFVKSAQAVNSFAPENVNGFIGIKNMG